MTDQIPNLPKQYDCSNTETKWQRYWESYKVFKADPSNSGEPYSIVIPPPNVTGSLHMGHAFEMALIDPLVRYHRMRGRNTLWLPGTDHASIATQTVLERQLKAEGKTRYDIGREKFLDRAWKWKAQSGGTIVNQLRRLGVSVDWSRERFTMDEGLSKAVIKAFNQLYEQGLIYRGNYMVNWCPASESAVSDLEVESKEVDGHLWHFRYPLTDGSGQVEVATTRPETMLGDTAVAVNPQDDRYRDLIGKTVTLPIMEREIPIIGDEFVDPEFGTGCVKVTPAHDPNDFEMGQRHQLPFINIMNKNGSLNENAGPFAGQDRFEARKNVVQRLYDEGLLVKVEEHKHAVPYSDRGKVPVEPLLSTQWFVKIRPLADKTLELLDNQNSPRFIPERWTKVYRDWLVKLEDWCISRQLWWGHQIPAWYAVSQTGGEITEETPFIVATCEEEAREKAIANYGKQVKLERDPDVLDTWFSSGLWPFSTMGWPDKTTDLELYYPTTTLAAGFDIIFFWVARMTMMGVHFTGEMPFKDVYIHGVVRDENNKKMSKSAGNGVDPLLLIDKYGTDALRYTLVREVAGASQDIRLEYDRAKDESTSVQASRNFANKLWNAARFVMMNLEGKTPKQLGNPNLEALELSDRWILSRYNKIVKQTGNYIDNYGLGEAAKGLYEFIWGDFCDWYIELVKSRLRPEADPSSRLAAQQTLACVLEGIAKLLHPFMPHITEEIWHTLTQANVGQSLALQTYPTVVDEEMEVKKRPEKMLSSSVSSPSSDTIAARGRNIGEKLLGVWYDLSKLASTVVNHYQPILAIALLLLVGVIVISGIAGVLRAINSIPALPYLLETIGVGYTLWFAFRHLLYAANRQQVGEKIKLTWKEVVGEPEMSKPQISKRRSSPVSSISKQTAVTLDEQTAPSLEEQFDLLIETIRTIRNLRAEAEIKPVVKVPAILQSENPRELQILTAGQSYIKDLAKVEKLTITPVLDRQIGKTRAGVVGTTQVLISLDGVVDVEALRAKLQKELSKIEADIQSLSSRLNNPGFVNKAPSDVVQGARDALAESQKQAEILRDRLNNL